MLTKVIITKNTFITKINIKSLPHIKNTINFISSESKLPVIKSFIVDTLQLVTINSIN